MSQEDDMPVSATGGQVDEMVMALIDACYDKDEMVKGVMCSSLQELGKQQPALVLSSCQSYLRKHNKLAQGHRVVILDSMEKIINDTHGGLDQDLARSLIGQASAELTQSKEVVPEWQGAASGVLVALGNTFCNEVMEELQTKFQPGVLPHFFVVQTMANLASSNVYGMVPFLKVVLGTMLPMLGLAKQDNMRWVFSSAMSKFSEAILDYVANIEKAPDPSVKKEFFSAEIDAAYDIVFNVWLQSRENRLRVVIVEALGQMSHIMTPEKLDQELPRLLQAILSLYKRHQTDPYHITQGLGLILAAAVSSETTCLETHLDNLLSTLFPQMCQPVDYNNPMTVKNHNELLRCYTTLAEPYSGRLVPYLLQKLEGGNERTRVATVSILRHLINSADSVLEDKKQHILIGLKILLNETSNKVKKELAQTVMAMSHHGYLELDGGPLMIEFITRQCCVSHDPQSKRPNDPEYVSNEALRSMCENVLQLMCTTVDDLDTVLWPYLLEFLVPEQYFDAMGAICRCVASIGQKKRDENATDYMVNFEEDVNVPKPQEIFARLLVMYGRPTGGRYRGAHVLNALRALSPNIDASLVELWDTVIPKMVHYFEENQEEPEKWSQKNWEDLVLKLLSKTLDQINDENWTEGLGDILGRQLPHYSSLPEEKNFAFKALGIVMRKSNKKDFVLKHLDIIFSNVKHSNEVEREGCAMAMGFVAAAHLDNVLVKLESVGKNETGKRSSGLFSFIKDSVSRSDVDDKTKSTLILSYGYVCLFAPHSIIASRIETTIIKAISPHFPVVKKEKDLLRQGHSDICIKHALIETSEMIGRTMHPEHLMTQSLFNQRAELLTHMQNYLKMEPPGLLTTETRSLALRAAATLVKLDPVLEDEESSELLKASLDSVMTLPPGGCPNRKSKEETYEELVHTETLMNDVISGLEGLIRELLLKQPTPEGLEAIYKHLHTWSSSNNDHERERSLTLCYTLFSLYLQNLQVKIGMTSHFSNLGTLLGRLVPRCTDPHLPVRQTAIDCVQTVLKIALRYQGHGADYQDEMVEQMPTLRERIKKTDSTTLFNVSKDIGKLVSKLVPADQLLPLLGQLYEGLADPHGQSSSGTCVILNTIVKTRGGALPHEVEPMLAALLERLPLVTCKQTYTGTLRAVRTLASHHLLATMTALLNYPLPFNEHNLACWRVIGEEKSLVGSMFNHLLEVLNKSLPYEEKPGAREKDKSERTATPLPLAATCALAELFKVEEAAEQLSQLYPSILGAVMVRVASTVDVKPPKRPKDEKNKEKDKKDKKDKTKAPVIDPSQMSTEALRDLLMAGEGQDIIDKMAEEEAWPNFADEELFPEAFTLLARLVVEQQPQHVCKLINVLNPVLASVYEPQRVMVAAVFAEMINQKCAGDLALVEMLVNSLLGRLVDSSHIVRKLCIRGLGNVASVGREQVQRHSTTVLSAMMAGMDDKEDLDDDITLEAMSGLSRILAQIDESHIRAILINIALRIRPCFEKEKAAVRAAAFTLFGNLSRFGDGPSKAPFLEQIHTNFVSLLLHLNDPDMEVRTACKYSLRLLGPLIGSDTINNMFQKHLREGSTLHYGEFMNDLAKAIVVDFPDKLNFYVMGNVTYFRSTWSEIKSNAAMFVGFLLGNTPTEQYGEVSKEHVCSALVMLLKDTSPEVRIKASEAMSRLHKF